jgi:hypothetical protein
MRATRNRHHWCICMVLMGALCVWASSRLEAAPDELAIGDLLGAGWQVAGYTSTVDNRSTFILFRHPDEAYLVQCRTGYDVTRTPRVHSNCYKLR